MLSNATAKATCHPWLHVRHRLQYNSTTAEFCWTEVLQSCSAIHSSVNSHVDYHGVDASKLNSLSGSQMTRSYWREWTKFLRGDDLPVSNGLTSVLWEDCRGRDRECLTGRTSACMQHLSLYFFRLCLCSVLSTSTKLIHCPLGPLGATKSTPHWRASC